MPERKRLLAAIMFTDMVGFTAMMQENEEKAKQLRDLHRSVLEEKISNHGGDLLQYYGDGTLSIFKSGIEAVKCAVNIQSKFSEEPKIPVRIGIHIGDIVKEEDGIYGDGVNIASRIESISVPGSVIISDRLQAELSNQPEIKAKSLGKFELKNVKRQVEIFAVASGKIKVPSSNELKSDKVKSVKSIAVLPFVNMSADPENEYFSDGITEEILNALVKVDGLQVTSRTSSFAFKNKNQDMQEIGNQLKVSRILEGSVRKVGKRVRITAQLINTSDNFHIWSEVYDRNLEDIFQVQDEIASKIANTLREKLTGIQQKEHLITAPTKNLEVYNYYLKGNYNLNKWNPESARKGIEYFEKAISMEADFAPAHSSLAFCYTMLGAMGYIEAKVAYDKARKYSLNAIKLDDTLADAHTALGLISVFVDWDLGSALQSFKRAISLSPGDAKVYHAYYVYLIAVGNLDEAIKVTQKAVQLDPLSLPINKAFGDALLNSKKYDEAIEQFDKTLELDPNFRTAIEAKAWAILLKGENDKAIETFKEYQSKTDDPLKGQTALGYAFAVSGFTDEAKKCLRKMEQREKKYKDVNLNMDYAVIYTGLKDFDKVFYYLDKSLDEGNVAFFFKAHPFAEELRKDPRFQEYFEKIERRKSEISL
ncbi:MAG: adenylate/guanylate cyclase domain-containing protein [Ignavibacteriaceae bacterium]